MSSSIWLSIKLIARVGKLSLSGNGLSPLLLAHIQSDNNSSMKADVTLLNHFSARYPKMPPSLVDVDRLDPAAPVIAVAFDHARMRLGDMWKLNHYLPALERNFSETVEEGDEEADALGGVVSAVEVA